jgi:hypothetical protein
MNENNIKETTKDIVVDAAKQVAEAIPVEADRKNIALGVGVAATTACVTLLIRCCIRKKKQKNDQDLTANTGADDNQASEDDFEFENCDSAEE